MQRYRLIKPDWGKEGHENFVRLIEGPNVIEGYYAERDLLTKNGEGYNIYYFPNGSSKRVSGFLRGRDVDQFRVAFVDMDLKDGVYKSKEEFLERVLSFPCPPTSIVDSGNGIHAYWRVRDLDRESYLRLQKKLIRTFKTDDSVWTVLQLMRAPGFQNTKKHDNFKLAEETALSDDPISVEDLERHLPGLDESDLKDIITHAKRVDGILEDVDMQEADINNVPEKFKKLLETNDKARELFYNAEKGSRSESDMKLANILFSNDFDIREAIQVIANTSKAKSAGNRRLDYAETTCQKVYERATYVTGSAAEKLALGAPKLPGRRLHGPHYFDCLHHGWRTKQILGLIGPTGCGKSTACMDMFRGMMEGNPESDDIFIYFNLEMPEDEILSKWSKLTGGRTDLAKRFYVISNEDANGEPRNINLQQIVWYVRDLQKVTGRKVGAIAIDHIGCINPQIDIRKKPTFGLEGETEGMYETFRTVSARKMPEVLKSMAKQLDCFIIVQSQTTKEKAGEGDTPLGMGAAYGSAHFEHYMDYIMTIWQPIKRVQKKTRMGVMGWKYCKIRNKSSQDAVSVDEPCALHVDVDSGRLRDLESEEFSLFETLKEEADKMRKMAEKKEGVTYSRVSVKGLGLGGVLKKLASNE